MQKRIDGSHEPFVIVSVHGLRIDMRKGTITFPGLTDPGRRIEPAAGHSEEIEAVPKTQSL